MNWIHQLLRLCLLSAAAQGATITISSGLPNSGVTLVENGVPLTNFFVGPGIWDGTLFTPFDTVHADTGKINGSFTATGPSLFNSQKIYVFAGSGNSIAASGNTWVIFSSTANVSFPADVSAAINVTFAMTTPSALVVDATGGYDPTGFIAGGTNTNLFNINTVPETSTILMGAVGALGLLRRRRN